GTGCAPVRWKTPCDTWEPGGTVTNGAPGSKTPTASGFVGVGMTCLLKRSRWKSFWRQEVGFLMQCEPMEKGYTGWTIRTGFLGGNLFGDTSGEERPIDYEESVRRYGEMLQEALEQEFPGARIIVRWEIHVSGATPYNLQTRAFDPEG